MVECERINEVQIDGWNYRNPQEYAKDCRKQVTLKSGGMVWVGIRAYDYERHIWLNNGEPEMAKVIAWRDIPEPATGYWLHGKLYI